MARRHVTAVETCRFGHSDLGQWYVTQTNGQVRHWHRHTTRPTCPRAQEQLLPVRLLLLPLLLDCGFRAHASIIYFINILPRCSCVCVCVWLWVCIPDYVLAILWLVQVFNFNKLLQHAKKQLTHTTHTYQTFLCLFIYNVAN